MHSRSHKAQTFIEYVLLFGVVTGLLIAMSPMIRRFSQAMIKVTADQIGNQRLSDQKGGESGYLINVYIKSDDEAYAGREDRLGVTTYFPETSSTRNIIQHSNLGLSD